MTSVEAAETTGSQLNAAQLRHLAPLIDRLGRSLTDAAPHIAALADALPSRHSQQSQAGASSDDNGDEIENLAAQASHLYFGLNTEENNGTQSHSATASTTTVQVAIDETTNIDPDVTSFTSSKLYFVPMLHEVDFSGGFRPHIGRWYYRHRAKRRIVASRISRMSVVITACG